MDCVLRAWPVQSGKPDAASHPYSRAIFALLIKGQKLAAFMLRCVLRALHHRMIYCNIMEQPMQRESLLASKGCQHGDPKQYLVVERLPQLIIASGCSKLYERCHCCLSIHIRLSCGRLSWCHVCRKVRLSICWRSSLQLRHEGWQQPFEELRSYECSAVRLEASLQRFQNLRTQHQAL